MTCIDIEKTEPEQRREDQYLSEMRKKYRKLTGKPVSTAMDSKIREYVRGRAERRAVGM